MARCNSCMKFCPVELQEPDDGDLECDGMSVGGTIRLSLLSGCCGDEVAEATVEIDLDLPEHECPELPEPDPDGCQDEWDGWEYEFEIEATDRYQGRAGAPVRYQRHYYGAELTVNVTCPLCKATDSVRETYEEQASCFEEIC